MYICVVEISVLMNDSYFRFKHSDPILFDKVLEVAKETKIITMNEFVSAVR